MAKLRTEDLVVLVLFGMLALAVPTVIVLRHFLELDPLAWLHITWGRSVAGWLCGALAAAICLLNFYLVYLAPWLYRRRHGSMEDYASISGLPMLGSIFVLCAAALLPPDPWLGAALLLIYHLDGNGLPAFVYAVTRYGL